MKNRSLFITAFTALLAASASFAQGPGGGGMSPGGGGNQPGGNQPGGSGATFTFDTFLAAATTNSSKCIYREGVWTGWASGITAATLSSAITNLAPGVCSGCTTLTSVNLSSCTSLAEIPDSAFAGCTALTTVTLPASCTAIGPNAFAGCAALTTLAASGVASVGSDAFRGCEALTAVPSGATALGDYAFAHSGVTTADISGLLSVGEGAFAGCESLASATVASGATLPDAVFAGCTALEQGDWSGVAEFGQASIAGIPATALTLNPNATLAAYALAADEATVETTLSNSALPSFADTAFLGREVSYTPVAGSVARIEASDLVDWLASEADSASPTVTQPSDYSTATLDSWLANPSNAHAYAYADDIAVDEDFIALTIEGGTFIYKAPSDTAISISVEPVACYTLSSNASDWSSDKLTSDDGINYTAADEDATSCFVRLRYTWDWQ